MIPESDEGFGKPLHLEFSTDVYRRHGMENAEPNMDKSLSNKVLKDKTNTMKSESESFEGQSSINLQCNTSGSEQGFDEFF